MANAYDCISQSFSMQKFIDFFSLLPFSLIKIVTHIHFSILTLFSGLKCSCECFEMVFICYLKHFSWRCSWAKEIRSVWIILRQTRDYFLWKAWEPNFLPGYSEQTGFQLGLNNSLNLLIEFLHFLSALKELVVSCHQYFNCFLLFCFFFWEAWFAQMFIREKLIFFFFHFSSAVRVSDVVIIFALLRGYDYSFQVFGFYL